MLVIYSSIIMIQDFYQAKADKIQNVIITSIAQAINNLCVFHNKSRLFDKYTQCSQDSGFVLRTFSNVTKNAFLYVRIDEYTRLKLS